MAESENEASVNISLIHEAIVNIHRRELRCTGSVVCQMNAGESKMCASTVCYNYKIKLFYVVTRCEF